MSNPSDHFANANTPRLSIAPATANEIRCWSYGTVRTDELLDRELGRFHNEGLFSERAFGPVHDFRCGCGKFSGPEHAKLVCDQCGVLVTTKSLRGQRFAHIELPVPVLHPWFWGHNSAPAEQLLRLSHAKLRSLVNRTRFILLDAPGPHLACSLTSAENAQREGDNSLDGFLYRSGAHAVKTLLSRLDHEPVLSIAEEKLRDARTRMPAATIERQQRRVDWLRSIAGNRISAQGLVIEALPVIPAGLRVIWLNREGQIKVDNISARYQRILRWCRSIARCLDRAPFSESVWSTNEAVRQIIWREERLAAEIGLLFEELFVRGCPASGCPKGWDRRRAWQGKRVDFSARSVVVPDPSLRLFECRLPEKSVLSVLLAPFSLPEADGTAPANNRLADEASKHPVVCTFSPVRRPTDVMALHPKPSYDNAIHVHPLLATTLGRTFADLEAGIHLPLSAGGENDCDRLSFPEIGLRDPIFGDSSLRLSADAVIGCYYASWLSFDGFNRQKELIKGNHELRAKISVFRSVDEARLAWENGRLHLHDQIGINLCRGQELHRRVLHPEDVRNGKFRAATTLGRAVFNSFLPPGSPYYDLILNAPALEIIVRNVLDTHGAQVAQRIVERLAQFGFQIATRSGMSLGSVDLRPPAAFDKKLAELDKTFDKLDRYFDRGIINDFERRQRIYDEWKQARTDIMHAHMSEMQEEPTGPHPLLSILATKIGLAISELPRLSGIIGCVWTPRTHTYPVPILSGFSRGVGPLEYFQLSAVARREHIENALKPAKRDRLQRQIMNVLGDVVIAEDDCGTHEGIVIRKQPESEDVEKLDVSFTEQITGRVSLESVLDPHMDEIILRRDELVSRKVARRIEECGVASLRVRSPVFCNGGKGLCSYCYGADLATGQLIEPGSAVGVKAAFAIGTTIKEFKPNKPRRQPDRFALHGAVVSERGGVVSLKRLRVAIDRQGQRIVVSPGGVIELIEGDNTIEEHRLPHGAVVHFAAGSRVANGERLASWDTRIQPVYSQDSGTVQFKGPFHGRGDRFINIVAGDGTVVDGCFLPGAAELLVEEGARVEIGSRVAEFEFRYEPPVENQSIGLERFEELLELRPPGNPALLAESDGRVELRIDEKNGGCAIFVNPSTNGEAVPRFVGRADAAHVIARTGQIVEAGEPLTRGDTSLRDLVRVHGLHAAQSLLLTEFQDVFFGRPKGRCADDRSWEILISRMLGFVRIESQGDSPYRVGQILPRSKVMAMNRRLRGMVRISDSSVYPGSLGVQVVTRLVYELAEKRRSTEHPDDPPPESHLAWPAGWTPLLMGLEELSNLGSFLTGNRFHPTREALVNASLEGRTRQLEGVAESILAGRLIPAGSGWHVSDE